MYSVIGILSDAHGNGPAFSKAVQLLLEKGAEHIFFLGDAIGYIPSTAVLDHIIALDSKITCIMGNHEDMLLKDKLDPQKDSVYQLLDVKEHLSDRHMQTIKNWPSALRQTLRGQRLLFIHGSPEDETYGYVYPDSDISAFTPEADWILMGNTHRPFIRQHLDMIYVNVGSCGLPRDDGSYGSAAILNLQTKETTIFRFKIKEETETVMLDYPNVHSSVREVYQRSSENLIGVLA